MDDLIRRSPVISIHAPPRGATTPTTQIGDTKFQFTPLREGRHQRVAYASKVGQFQFTPLREGRQLFLGIGGCPLVISIHAPPRGAT